MQSLYPLFRPLLFATDPEFAHDLVLRALDAAARAGLARAEAAAPATTPVSIMGIRFPNRVGLAAGLDKNAAHLRGLATLGFGFLEAGTVTPRSQPGNPRPRMFRLPAAQAIVNRLGFNNEGVERFVANVARSGYRGILGVNIGKNFDTPNERAADDYVTCLRAVYLHPDGSEEFKPMLGGKFHAQDPENEVKRYYTYRNRGYLLSQPGMRKIGALEIVRFGLYFVGVKRDPKAFLQWLKLVRQGRAEKFYRY